VDDTSANYNGHAGWVNTTSDNPGDCGSCHKHDAGFAAGCAGCHEYPPTSGAHTAHAGTAGGKPEFNCETCHGPGPGSAAWHNQSDVSTYDPDVHFANITLSSDLNTTQRDVENAYYNTTWTRAGTSVPPSVTKAGAYAFECTNVYCHGLDSVTWTWDAAATGNPASLQAIRTCGGCHGVATDIDGDSAIDPDHDNDGFIDVASFRSRAGTQYQASNAAANYEVPISGFSRGGHGDTFINDPQWFEDTADGTELPVSCTTCHDASKDHFPVATADPYRMSAAALNDTLPGRDVNQTPITNLCTQSNCHPKLQTVTGTGTYAFAEAPKHPNDHFTDWLGGTSDIIVDVVAPINLSGSSSTTSPRYDPVGVVSNGDPDVQQHIDRYVDHWEWRNPSSPATGSNSDDVPFLPLGDSLGKQVGNDYDNDLTTNVTCITCHNPHGTDLHVVGQTPGSGSTVGIIPANRMLRLRDQDSELCSACH